MRLFQDLKLHLVFFLFVLDGLLDLGKIFPLLLKTACVAQLFDLMSASYHALGVRSQALLMLI